MDEVKQKLKDRVYQKRKIYEDLVKRRKMMQQKLWQVHLEQQKEAKSRQQDEDLRRMTYRNRNRTFETDSSRFNSASSKNTSFMRESTPKSEVIFILS